MIVIVKRKAVESKSAGAHRTGPVPAAGNQPWRNLISAGKGRIPTTVPKSRWMCKSWRDIGITMGAV
ncbi:hypothetical protein KCP74_02775 [Salmonella enterica subsp. enterica]|nr:hypothetical protein KCP74_02775 [Salmonella enterica subsp. enterica]